MTKYTYNERRKEWYTLVYDGTFNADGSKHRKRIASKKSSADLEKKVQAFKEEVRNAGATRPAPYTFGEYAQLWFETSKSTKEINTKNNYKSVIDTSFSSISSVPLTQITHAHFQMCINEKQDHPRMCQLVSLTFKQIIRGAVKARYLPRTAIDDILEDISLPKYKKPVKRPLNDLEKTALANADLDAKKRCFVSILYYCGLRKQEALALTKEDFDFEKKTVSISKAWVNDRSAPSIKPYPKSDNGVRVVPLPDQSIQYIQPYVETTGQYVFRNSNCELMTESSYKVMWRSILCSLNMAVGYEPQKKRHDRKITDLTAHVFRHNYCTELCYQVPAISTKMIARLLGDTEKMVLDVYSHILEERESPTDALNNIFN